VCLGKGANRLKEEGIRLLCQPAPALFTLPSMAGLRFLDLSENAFSDYGAHLLGRARKIKPKVL
jgi:hypothetical protein